MKKIIRLTESELTKVIRRVINEAPQGSSPTYAVTMGKDDVRWSYASASFTPSIYLYGDPTGVETTAGYFLSGEKYKFRLYFTNASMQPGSINWSVTWKNGTAGGGGSGSVPITPLDQASYNTTQTCKTDKTKSDVMNMLKSTKGYIGIEYCSWLYWSDIEITMPTVSGATAQGQTAGTLSFAGSQGITSYLFKDGKTTPGTTINLYWPPNTRWGIPDPNVKPKAVKKTP